jgi:lipopolysaccharide export system permease protein
MSRLTRHLFLQLLGWVALAAGGAAVLFLASQLLRVAPVFAGAGAGAGAVASALAWLLVPVLGWALAPALAVAILAVFGRMEVEGELVAVDAAGLSRSRLVAAPSILALALAGIAGFIALEAGPACQRALRGLAFELAGNALLGRARPGVFHSPVAGVTLFAERVEGSVGPGLDPRGLVLEGVLVEDARDTASPLLVLARRAELGFDPVAGAIEARLSEGTAFHRAAGSVDATLEFDELTLRVDALDDLASRLGFLPGPLAARTADLFGPPPPGVTDAQWGFAFWRRVASPFGLLALAAAALAIGLSSRLRGRAAGVVAAALLFLALHLAGRLAESLALGGAIPPSLAALAPAAIVLVAACIAGTSR